MCSRHGRLLAERSGGQHMQKHARGIGCHRSSNHTEAGEKVDNELKAKLQVTQSRVNVLQHELEEKNGDLVKNFHNNPNQLDVCVAQVSTVMGIVAGDMLPTLNVSQKCGFDVVA